MGPGHVEWRMSCSGQPIDCTYSLDCTGRVLGENRVGGSGGICRRGNRDLGIRFLVPRQN